MVLSKQSNFKKTILPNEAERFTYRWVVLFCSFLVRLFVFGSVMSVGVLYVEWLKEFQLGFGDTALIGSIATGSVLLMGPVASALLDRFSCRQVIITSGIVMSGGLIASSFSNGVPYLCFSFGVVTGCAGGIANLASIVSLSQYFNEQRPLAMGVGSSGTGLGIFVYGLLQKSFISDFTWRGSLLLVGGLQLHLVLCGMLMIHPNELRHHKSLFAWRTRPSNLVVQCSDECSSRTVHFEDDSTVVSTYPEGSANANTSPKAEVAGCSNNGITVRQHSSRQDRRRSTFQMIRSKLRLKQKTIDLWKDPAFLVLFFSDFLSWLVQFVPYVHLPTRAAMLNLQNGAVLVSIMGFCSAFGKVIFGAVCTFFSLSPFKVFIVSQTLMGLSTVLSPLCVQFWTLCVFAVCFGILSGSYGLMMVIPARWLGEEKFSLAYGFMLAGEGIGVYLGPPLVGWITDATESYNSSFYVAGCILIASALVLMIQPCREAILRRNRKVRHMQAW